jgi:hypothetical protein
VFTLLYTQQWVSVVERRQEAFRCPVPVQQGVDHLRSVRFMSPQSDSHGTSMPESADTDVRIDCVDALCRHKSRGVA